MNAKSLCKLRIHLYTNDMTLLSKLIINDVIPEDLNKGRLRCRYGGGSLVDAKSDPENLDA